MSTQKERVFQAVLAVLGSKYDPTEKADKYFHPVNTLNGIQPRLPLPGKNMYLTKKEISELRALTQDSAIKEDNIEKWYREYGFNWLTKISQQKCSQFYRGPIPWPYVENPLLTKVIEISRVPRNAVFESLRRDPRLNGGVKRVWKKSNTKPAAINEEKYLELKSKDTLTKSILTELKKNQDSRNLLLLQLQTRKFELFLKANNLDPDDFSSALFNDLILKKSA